LLNDRKGLINVLVAVKKSQSCGKRQEQNGSINYVVFVIELFGAAIQEIYCIDNARYTLK